MLEFLDAPVPYIVSIQIPATLSSSARFLFPWNELPVLCGFCISYVRTCVVPVSHSSEQLKIK